MGQEKNGKVAPSNLTDGELFGLVAYVLDVRKKDSSASYDMNFSSQLRAVRRHPEDVGDEMSICLGHFSNALDKRKVQDPQTLYCCLSAESCKSCLCLVKRRIVEHRCTLRASNSPDCCPRRPDSRCALFAAAAGPSAG